MTEPKPGTAGGRRWTLLLALLPLILGLAVYGQLWRGWAAQFETTLAGWFPDARAEVGGFPYRLETELLQVARRAEGVAVMRATVQRLRLNRGPWRPELTVMQGEGVMLTATLPGWAPRVTAPAATASLKLDGDRLVRASVVLPGAAGVIGLGGDGAAFTAESLELHAREIEPAAGVAAGTPNMPRRGQLVIGAEGLKIGQGDPISLAGEALVNGRARLRDWQRWAGAGGSVDLVLSGRDATGEIFALNATMVPVQPGWRLAGTIRTVCPAAVQAALAGTPAPAEQRLRAPVQMAIETSLPAAGAVAVRGVPADIATRPRRAQLQVCPKLR